ncbi:MAG: hypothetical protein ABFC30_08550 [Proteiniphilum sp.]
MRYIQVQCICNPDTEVVEDVLAATLAAEIVFDFNEISTTFAAFSHIFRLFTQWIG